MEFAKKLKIRMYVGIIFIIIGIAITVAAAFGKTENRYISSLGLAIAVVGVVRIRNYLIITKNSDSVKKREIAETDERNVTIMYKARSTAFIIFVLAAALLSVVTGIIGMRELSVFASYSVMALTVIYWICYVIYQKKL